MELVSDLWVNDSSSGVVLKLSLEMSGPLGLGSGFVALFNLFLVELDVITSEVPLSERVGINGDDAVLDDSLGSDKLIVSGVVDDIQNSGLSGEGLGAPGEVSSINSECSEFVVSTSSSDWSDSLGTKLGVGWLSTHLELSLLLMNWHSSTGGSSLVSRVSVDSHDFYFI